MPEQEILELTIESIGFEGKAIARLDGLVYFVDGGAPGDVVRARALKRKKKHAEAVVVEILQPSPQRVDPRCSHFGVCGGCKWQHLDYAEQLVWKRRHVQDAFERLGKVSVGEIRAALPSPEEYGYRNKMEFSFGDSRWLTAEEIASQTPIDRSFALGLHIPGRFDKVLDVERCFLQGDAGNKALRAARQAAKERGCAAFETRRHTGFLRNLVVRFSRSTGEMMVVLVTSPPACAADESLLRWFEQDFPALCPEATTGVHAVSRSKAAVAGGVPRAAFGEGFITETILGERFRISPFSFFQTNTLQAEKLFSAALEFAELGGESVVWDLYCGAGSMTLPAARRAKFAAGIELSESAVADAKENAKRNGITNAEFYAQDMSKAARGDLLGSLPAPDVVIVDPPRAGMSADVVEALLAAAPPVLVYVSCNPATQARDCALLSERYEVRLAQPVDMFPHTYHIETAAQLVRRDRR